MAKTAAAAAPAPGKNILNWRVIRKQIQKQAEWLSAEFDRNAVIARRMLANDRRKWPSRADLIPYIARHTGRIIPYRRICRGHSAPAEFIDHMMYEDEDVLALACRSGSKTMQFGVASGMDAYHKKLSSRVLGASGDQSSKVYDEFKQFMESGFEEAVVGEMLQKKTELTNNATVELLLASRTSVRGPHVPRLRMDEIDEMTRSIFNDAMSIPQSAEGQPSVVAEASTRHHPFGIMSEEVETFHGTSMTWCVFEIMEACRSKSECRSCNLSKYCPGWKTMKDAVGYFTLLDAQKQRRRIKDDDVYESEALCWKPQSEGQIYLKLDKGIHMPCELPVRKDHGLYRVFDYGTDHPTVLGYWQLIEIEGRWQGRCVDEIRWRGTAPSVIVKEMLEYEKEMGWEWFEDTLVPMDAAGFRAELVGKGIETSIPDQSVEDGIGTIKNALVPDINGTVGLLLDSAQCVDTFQEMHEYHRKNGKVAKKKDDGPDMVRYFFHSMAELRAEVGDTLVDLGELY